MTIKVRKGAYRKYEPGTIFREVDGPYIVIDVKYFSKRFDEGIVVLGPYDYTLQKLTPDEITIYEVMES